MKKIILSLTAILFCLVLFACGNITTTTTTTVTTTATTPTETTSTTTAALSTPASFQIVGNVVTFETVANANKYKLNIADEFGNPMSEINITSGFNLFLLLAEGTYQFKVKAAAPGYGDSAYSDLLTYEIVDPDKTGSLEGESLNNFEFVRWIGRTYFDVVENAKYFYFTASGFEVAFYGTELKVTLKASYYNVVGRQAYVVVLVDGEEDPTQGTTLVLNQAEAEYTVVTGLAEGFHTVKLLKRSEASDSDTAVKKIATDGYFTAAPLPKSFRIQYIAASSSTGYGNLGSLSEPKTTANSDGLRGYAYLTSYLLDAEANIFAASGWGVTRGYNTGGSLSATQTIPAAYEYFAIDDSNFVFTAAGEWAPSDYVPDVIVVNLGTNDFNASGYVSMSAENKALVSDQFIADYTAFLRRLNNTYPGAVIIVAYGLMGEAGTLGGFTNTVIANANAAIGDTVVYAFLLEAGGSNGQPFGSNYHPNVQTSMNNAEDLAAFISSLTGREVVYDMIGND